jgi:transcriptional repressor NrdR
VVKRDGTRQSFDRNKILTGIDKAAEKTTITALQREEMVNDIEQKLYATGEPEMPSTLVGELVMNALADADDVAYVRFASVYRHFTSIQGFQRELDRIKERAAKG